MGSGTLRAIETRFLHENVRVKSFKNATIDFLNDKLCKMDLSRYRNVILHIGGHDVDAKIDPNTFKDKYASLLMSLSDKGCDVFVSGLLPRGGTNMTPYNDILRELSVTNKAKFVNNHDSFILASGGLPFDYFQSDKVSLIFPGIRVLVHNINNHCPILPPRKFPQAALGRAGDRQNRHNRQRPYKPVFRN